jgi:hypothetical protein
MGESTANCHALAPAPCQPFSISDFIGIHNFLRHCRNRLVLVQPAAANRGT